MLAIWVSCYLTYGGQLAGKRSNNGPAICSLPAKSHEMGVEGSELVGGKGQPPWKPYLEAPGRGNKRQVQARPTPAMSPPLLPLDCQAEESLAEFVFHILISKRVGSSVCEPPARGKEKATRKFALEQRLLYPKCHHLLTVVKEISGIPLLNDARCK